MSARWPKWQRDITGAQIAASRGYTGLTVATGIDAMSHWILQSPHDPVVVHFPTHPLDSLQLRVPCPSAAHDNGCATDPPVRLQRMNPRFFSHYYH
jgi:hypothetical protein